MAAMKHRRMWVQAFRRLYTPQSMHEAVQEGDSSKLVERDDPKSVRDSLEPFQDKSRVDRYNAYLIMAKEMPGASADTLRKIRRRLGIEG